MGPVWPEQSVEQVLDQGLGVVSEVRIWAAAGVDRGEAPVVAALLQGRDRKLVRQVEIKVQPSNVVQPYVLEFAPYYPASGEELILPTVGFKRGEQSCHIWHQRATRGYRRTHH